MALKNTKLLFTPEEDEKLLEAIAPHPAIYDLSVDTLQMVTMAMTDRDGDPSLSLASSCSKLPHSHSTPVGVDGGISGGAGTGSRTPPTTPKKGGKMLAMRVQMLDDTITMFQVQAKAIGRVLFDQVCKQLHLLEADYFGLEYQDAAGTRYWLDLEKPLHRQVGLSLVDPLLRFCVKFYTPDPSQLEEEFTRYLFCLQIKRDLAQGHTQCNDNTAALMASYIVQAECGDFVAEDYPDATYLSTYKFVPHQDRELERRIMENHKKHAGQSPAEADLNLLETARRCELYGMKMHPAKDHEGVPLNLSVAHMGIVVFQNFTKINTFSWAKIRKISFKRKRFLIKLHPEGYGYYKDTVEFFFEGRNECKNFWKKCVENHGFFRCSTVKRVPRQRTRVLSRGSSFRYSGKTQKQIVEFVRENYVKRTTFQRSQSFRHSSSVHSSVATNVGGSISAHPLLPLGDSSIVSLSCGSMSLAGVGAGSPSPTVRRLAQTNPAMTTVTSLIHSDTPSRHASYTQGQMYDTNTPYSPQSSITESYCRHCGEGFDSIPSSRRSSTRIKETRSSQTDIVDIEDYEEPVIVDKRYTWQRSASCKELIGMKSRTFEVKTVERTLEAPVTRYDDSQRSCYSIAGSKTPSIDRSTVDVPETKVYSSSYPGTTSSLSTESGGGDEGGLEPGGSVLVIDTGSSREEIILSHDDLSHDSYELLEREGALLYGDSRSCSLDSAGDQLPDDEMFLMDDDFDTRDGSDVEKRLGYVEPRYGDIGFNEFNEKCKQGFAIKRAVEFGEFDAKCKPGMVIGFDDEVSSTGLNHYPVERTKSDPYVSDFWKVAKQHRKLLHQKSIDLTPTEPSGVDSSTYLGSSTLSIPSGSKSVVDIPYTLYKRHHMNGTATEKSFDYKSPQILSPAKLSPVPDRKSPMKSPEVARREKTKSPKRNGDSERLSKTKMKPDLNSQDSGLSLSLGTESADDLQDIFSRNDNNILELKKDDTGETITYKHEVVDAEINIKETVVANVKKTDLLTVPDEVIVRDKSGKKDLVKGKSEETSKSKKGTLTKSRQVHSADGGLRKDGSFEKRDSAVKVIKIDSGSCEAVCHCDRKDLKRKDVKSQSLENADPDVIIVEYRGNRKRAFQKKSSSGSKDSVEKDIKRSGSLDAPKTDKKTKDTRLVKSRSNSREEKKKSKAEEKASKDYMLTDKSTEVQVVEEKDKKDESKEISGVINRKSKVTDKKHKDGDIAQEHEVPKKENASETTTVISKTDFNKDDDKSESSIKKSVTSPETTWKKFGDLPAPISHKRERSPILFARLGLSEGSVPTNRQSSIQSPSASRRAKSLDAPVVSLHRLPPVTSFSSKDDTVDNDENIELEEKSLRSGKSTKFSNDGVVKDSIQEESYTEPQINLVEMESNYANVKCSVELSEVKSNISEIIDISLNACCKTEIVKEKDEEVISATLEKLDEVVDRVKGNELLTDVHSNTTNLGKEKSLNLSPLSPTACFSPTRSLSPTGRYSPNQLTPTRRSSSPLRDIPGSPIRSAPLSPLSIKDAPLSPSLKDAPLSPSLKDAPHSPTIIEPPLSPSAERRPSTRQERLDSFKKSYSVDIWTSDEGDAPGVPAFEIEHVDYTSNDYDDEIFETEPEVKEKKDVADDKHQDEEEPKGIESESDVFEEHLDSGKATGNEVFSTTEDECWVSIEDIREMVQESTESKEVKSSDKEDSLKDDSIDISKVISERDTNKLEQTIKEFMEVIQPLDEPSTSGLKLIPEKRSFDEEPSSSSSIKQVELSSTWKPFPLESSGSSSLEEAIFPPDDTGHYADEEEGSSHSNGQDEFPTGFGYPMTGAEMMISGYTGSMFGLSRTLSRISERSTTSEQERSDFEDDISTKPSSRSLSVDDESLLSSDRQPSLSSDPPSGPNLEDQPLPDLPPLPKEPTQEQKLDFKIPPPLLPTASEEDWPSPPNSSPFDTPVISHVETFYMEIKPEEATKVLVVDTKDTTPEGNESSTDENKTLQEEYGGGFDDSTIQDGTVKFAIKPKTSTGVHGNSASEDTSIGISDWSSSTSTVKHCQYYSCAVKSDDSSFADFGLSLSTETISGRKSSDDSLAKFQVKRQGMFTVPPQRSFDDYDSPYSESDEGQAKPVQKRNQHSFYSSVSSPTSTLAVKKCQDRSKFNRSGFKCTPYYSTPTPVSHEHRDVSELLERRSSSKSIARSKCYSYYSLARSPPSDGSSSSLDNPEPPTTPNTIPRVSKRRRHIPPTKRRHRVSVDMEVRDGHIVSVSSPSVVAYSRNRHPTSSSDRDLVIDPARQHSTSCSKQSSV